MTTMPKLSQTNPLKTLRAYLATTCIGHSTLRNQDAKGVIQTARDYLAALYLNRFRDASNHSSYLEILNAIPAPDRLPHLRHLIESLYDDVQPLHIALTKLQNLDIVHIIEGKP